MEQLRVRVYNVEFGDAILVSVPDRAADGTVQMRHILIDVGNVLRGPAGIGGADNLFGPLIDDVLKELNSRPLDLYVMTHEHMDHVQGLFYAATKLGKQLTVDYAWLTASSAEDYYDRHENAHKQRLNARSIYKQISQYLSAASEKESELFRVLTINNNILDDALGAAEANPYSTTQCVAYLRQLATKRTSYVYRCCDLAGTHPFQEAQLEIWAPEENTADYYGRFQPMALGMFAGDGLSPASTPASLVPPAGVDAGAFYDLVLFQTRS